MAGSEEIGRGRRDAKLRTTGALDLDRTHGALGHHAVTGRLCWRKPVRRQQLHGFRAMGEFDRTRIVHQSFEVAVKNEPGKRCAMTTVRLVIVRTPGRIVSPSTAQAGRNQG